MSIDSHSSMDIQSNAILSRAVKLSDAELLARVKALVQQEREATTALIAHLAVLDERELYRAEGYSSLFNYCTQALHFSENEAYWRIGAARATRKFPTILDRLADGSMHLTAVVLLAPHLTEENHQELLSAAAHKSKRQVEELVVAVRPLPDVPSSIRRLPTKSTPSAPSAQSTAEASGTGVDLDFGLESSRLGSGQASIAGTGSLIPASSSAQRGSVEPLAPQRYLVKFTASAELYEKLRLAQDLLRHQIPDGDLEHVMDQALTALLDNLARQKFAATDRTRSTSPAKGRRANGSRAVPAEVKRAVRKRDGLQCAFMSASGHRCTERSLLEFHHVVPYSIGGQAMVENIQLRCRAHNGYEAERYFGRRKSMKKERSVREPGVTYSTRTLSRTNFGRPKLVDDETPACWRLDIGIPQIGGSAWAED